MKHTRISLAMLGMFAAMAALPAQVRAERVTIRQNSVIPVIISDDLAIRDSKVGDRFSARVQNDRDLPDGTKLTGRVREVQRATDDEPGYMDLEFTDLILPSGARVKIRALPVKWNDDTVRRDRDGHFQATSSIKKREGQVLGGTLGGLILGSIIKKPFEGAVIGAIAGVVMSENERKNGPDLVLAQGAKMGAMVERDFAVDLDAGRYDTDRLSESAPKWRNADPIRISYDDDNLRYSDKEQPYRQGGVVMVALMKTADQLEFDVSKGRSGVFYVNDDDHSLRLEQDSREYRLDGERGSMSRAICVRNGVVFVPLEVFVKLKHNKIQVNGNNPRDDTY